jgi:putative ABC transport system permease protein
MSRLHVVGRTAPIFAGTILGLAGSLAATQILKVSLYEVTPYDPQTYLLITLILPMVALLASYIPARRASAVDPVVTLRAE